MNPTDPAMPPYPGSTESASIATPQEPGGGAGVGSGSTADVAKEQAGDVKDTAKQAGGQVVGEAKQQAANVAGEVVDQTQNLLQQGLSEIKNRTGEQQQRLADTVHSWAKELGAMASASSESGPMTNLVQDASRRSGELAHWLQEHEPRDILHELRSFARRRPGTFLLAAATAGALAGRLTRGISANRSSGSSGSSTSAAGELPGPGTTPALPQGNGVGAAPQLDQPGTGSAGIGSAAAGTGPLDAPPAGPGLGTGTGLGSEAAGPGSAGPGFGPGGVGPGLSEPATGEHPISGGAGPTPSVPPTPPQR